MPIPIDKLQGINHIVVHSDADGVAAALIIKDCHPSAKVSVMQYDSPEHKNLPAEPGMIFADFSPYKERVGEFVEVGAIVLDHHQKKPIEAFGDLGVFGENAKTEAGAWLAYREVWLPLAQQGEYDPVHFRDKKAVIEELAKLASIRDTWKTDNPLWKRACEVSEALAFWPHHSSVHTPMSGWNKLLEVGPLLFERKLAKARQCIDGGWRFTTTKGTRCMVFVGILQVSDAAEILDQEVDLLLAYTTYVQEGGPVLRVSIRSHTGWDCAAFAQTFPGGGGHKESAGFITPIDTDTDPNAYAMIRQLVEEHEHA